MQRILDVVEKAGNMVPHPVLIFLSLIAIVIVLSHVLYVAGIGVTFDEIVPDAAEVSQAESGAYPIYDTGTTVEYKTLDEFRGNLSRKNIKDPFVYQRGQYVDILMNSEEVFKKYPMI